MSYTCAFLALATKTSLNVTHNYKIAFSVCSHWVHAPLHVHVHKQCEVLWFCGCVPAALFAFNVVWIFEVKGRCMSGVRSFREVELTERLTVLRLSILRKLFMWMNNAISVGTQLWSAASSLVALSAPPTHYYCHHPPPLNTAHPHTVPHVSIFTFHIMICQNRSVCMNVGIFQRSLLIFYLLSVVSSFSLGEKHRCN